MTIYVNFNRELIIDGFGSKVQFVNKLLSLLFNCQVKYRKAILANDDTRYFFLFQTPMRLFVALTWWTQWFGLGYRYRDMSRPFPIPRWVLFNKEFAPILFMLVELLWFDTMGKVLLDKHCK